MGKTTRRNAPKKIVVGLTEGEHRAIKSRAALEGKTLDAYARERLLVGLVQARRQPDEVVVTRARHRGSAESAPKGDLLTDDEVDALLKD